MKLTYRDKIILAIVLAAAIFAGGFFGLIKPKRQTIAENQTTLEGLEAKKAEIEKKIKRIDTVSKNIKQIHSDSKSDTAIFVDVDQIGETNNLTGGTKKLDEFMYRYAEEAHVKVTELKADPVSSANIGYYYESYNEVAGTLRESSDINGDLRKKVAEESADSYYISSRNVENIMTARYGLTVECTKKELWDYLSKIEDIDSTVIVTSVSFTIAKDENNTTKKASPTADGQPANQNQNTNSDEPQNIEDDTPLQASIVIQLYSVYEMDEPNTDMPKN